MPITETLEPRAPEELQLKIFATKTSEDYIIIREVCDHVRYLSLPFFFPSCPSHLHCHFRQRFALADEMAQCLRQLLRLISS